MLDRDIADLYEVETKILNQSVKRNIARFPKEFMFQLTEKEFVCLRSQFVTLKAERGKHTKYLPFVFTEQGVAMLSAILRSDKAILVSINIMKAFTTARKFILSNSDMLEKVNNLEIKILNTDKKVDIALNALNVKNLSLDQGIFFKGQIYDAYAFTADLIRSADKSIILIDNYINDSVLTLFTKRKPTVTFNIFTNKISKELQLDINKDQAQYGKIDVRERNDFHDRFLIIDDKTVFHFGASLKDLGNKCFAFNKLDDKISQLLMDNLN
ncbi:MAG: ORF6N domain-containing protein [Candidatus Marinimicrobia bacterium]|nr:ORF6N domain-containing protein [Candidatus Neomarinimicrobiota bacterium]